MSAPLLDQNRYADHHLPTAGAWVATRARALRVSARAMLLSASAALLPGCVPSSCVDYCQVLDSYARRCGTSWDAAYGDRGWTNIDDCYEDAWEANDTQLSTCAEDAERVANASCY